MGQCDKCRWYHVEYDELGQEQDDIIRVGEKEKDIHYCLMIPEGIPDKVWSGKSNCEYFVQKST